MEKNEHPISYKRIIAITYPVILSMFSLNIMVFVDRAFVAKYDLTQFAAIVPAGTIATAIAGFFVGIVGFTSTLVSQYYGARKVSQCVSSMWQGIYLSAIFSAVLLAMAPFAANIFQVMGHSGQLLLYEKQRCGVPNAAPPSPRPTWRTGKRKPLSTGFCLHATGMRFRWQPPARKCWPPA